MKIYRWLDILLGILFWGAGLLILLVLVSIFSYLVLRGGPILSWDFIFEQPKGFPLGTEGGVLPAIKGTVYLVMVSLMVAVIPGIATATYLAELTKPSKYNEILNITIQCMAGVPSIVIGLFSYAIFVVQLGFGISLLAGGLALGMMIFPVIVVTARDALLAVNTEYRKVGLGLGVSRWYLLSRVIFPQAAPAILSGILLSMGYAAGATAPIMVTAAVVSANTSGALFEPVMALPYHLYILFSQQISIDYAYGTALLLVLLLLTLNIVAMGIRSFKRKGA